MDSVEDVREFLEDADVYVRKKKLLLRTPKGLARVYTVTFADIIDLLKISTSIQNQLQLKVESCCKYFCATSSKGFQQNFETRDQPACKILALASIQSPFDCVYQPFEMPLFQLQ